MGFIKVTVQADQLLVGPLEDFLVGVMSAAVDTAADPSPVVTICAYVSEEEHTVDETRDTIIGHATELASILEVPAPEISCELLADENWAENWKQFFQPMEIVPGLVIVPSWEKDYERPAAADQVIVMDPGMAFGTGHHETTRLCLRLLREQISPDQGTTVLDVGTGTGILAMAAALFGATTVTAIDNDPEAVAAGKGNVLRNNLQHRVQVSGTMPDPGCGPYRIIVANIVHDTLLELSATLAGLAGDGTRLILSGIVCGDQVSSLTDHFSRLGFRCERLLEDKEWCAVLLTR